MKKVNKSEKIRKLLDKGMTSNEIIEKLGVSTQLVYSVSKNYGVKTKPLKRGRRPWKTPEQKLLEKIWKLISSFKTKG